MAILQDRHITDMKQTIASLRTKVLQIKTSFIVHTFNASESRCPCLVLSLTRTFERHVTFDNEQRLSITREMP